MGGWGWTGGCLGMASPGAPLVTHMRGPEDPSPSPSALSTEVRGGGRGTRLYRPGGCAGGGAAGEVPVQGACASAVAGSMAVPRGQEPACPSHQHCHIVPGAPQAAGAVWPPSGAREGSQAPTPVRGLARPSQHMASLLPSCWLQVAQRPPAWLGITAKRGAGGGEVLVTEQRCEGRRPWAQSGEGSELPMC